ncbi:MAG: autotransporter outer membrane beta-barrel domain-containing protein, partial [Planctomycetota bacterium]
MCKRLIFLMTLVLALGSTAHAALYLWNGSAGDGNWDTPANWTVTDSQWTWPNEEYGNRQVNSDTIGIDILNGDAVSRGGQLGIDGAADGSTTGVLTLNNGSSLTVGDDLATSTDPSRRGQIDVLGGSTLTVTGDNDIRIADDPDTWGMLNIVDSTVNIGDDLRLDEGEAYVNISGSSIVNSDDGITVADANTAVGYLDISGTAVITLVDDFKIDEGIGFVTIGGDAVISFGDDCYLPDQAGGQGTMTLTGNSVFNVGDDMTIADDAGTVGHVIVTGNATLNAPDELYLADAPTAFATMDVNGTATVNVGDDLDVGEDGAAVCNVGENATVIVGDTIYIPHHEQGIEARMTISGNALVTCNDLQVVNDGGNTGYLHISGNPTIIANEFLMNNDAGSPGTSEVIMDGGTVTVNGNSTINDDNNGTATFTMNGGSFYSSGYLNVSDNLDGTAHLTINGGSMITGDLDIKITDTKIIYTGGEFRISSADVNEADMQQLVADGTIVVDGVYSIATDRDYTVLNPLSPTQAKLPYPADGADGVLLGTTLSWAAGNTAVTHDVYFGTSSPPPLIGNQEATTYYPGPTEVGTTYYWQIVEVEADGTTKHSGEVWSFTTTTDLSTVSEIATQPNPADGAIDVALDATLSWWPGASA